MIERQIRETLNNALEDQPAVVLLEARQVGKTTVAQAVLHSPPAIYIDLEEYIERWGDAKSQAILRATQRRINYL